MNTGPRSRAVEPMGQRELSAVRALGAGIVAWFGQLAIDMPDGYFGATDKVTAIGLTYGGIELGLCLACALGMWWQAYWPRLLLPAILALNVAAFGPTLGSDPLVGLSVIAWQIYVLGRHLFPTNPTMFERRRPRMERSDAPGSEWSERFGSAIAHGLAISTACTVAVVGFRLTEQEIGPLSCLVVDALALGFATPFLYGWAARRPRIWLLVGIVSCVAAALWANLDALVGLLGITQGLLLAIVLVRGPLVADILRLFFANPGLLLVSTFGVVCLAGSVALSFPAAATARLSIVDALFTATSAVCVTGLIVRDTPVDFTTFGQVLILLLIQVGGLGIMTLSTFATLALGGRLGLRGEHALGQMLELSAPGQAYRLAKFIVLSTLAIEGVGALVLGISYKTHGFEWPEALWRGLFHAISAFCNAGFALQSDSLVMFRESPGTLLAFSILILAGGLGFVVLAWIWHRVTFRSRERASVHVKVVLSTSVALLVVGFIEYTAVEWNHSLRELGAGDKLVNAWFQAVTVRTAGFNSVDFLPMHPATVLTFTILMFIGASPGSTGGGIKTSTFAVLLASIPAIARGTAHATLFRRNIDALTVLRASTITMVALLLACTGSFALLIMESGSFPTLVFEAVSALGTVGLSLGATAELSTGGKIVIIAIMFVGRVGPLSLALLLARAETRHIEYPAAQLMVG